MNKLTSY